MDRKHAPNAPRALADEELSTVSGGNLAMAGKTGPWLVSYYDNKAAGNELVASFLEGALKGAGTPVPKHHT